MIEVLLLGGTGAMGTFLVDIFAKSKINCNNNCQKLLNKTL